MASESHTEQKFDARHSLIARANTGAGLHEMKRNRSIATAARFP
jgi:hypothetical protein